MSTENEFLKAAQERLGRSFSVLGSLPLDPSFEPHFHDVSLVADERGERFVMRIARPNLMGLQDSRMSRELENVGFFARGGTYALRAPVEQQKLHDACRRADLAVPGMIHADDRGSLVEFIDGPSLSILLAKDGSPRLMRRFLKDVLTNQRAGFVLGDRHCCNAILDRRGRLWQIDADVRIMGPYVRELEACQAIFFSLHSLVRKVEGVAVALEFLSEADHDYDFGEVRFFLESFCTYKGAYTSDKYKAVIPFVVRFLEELPS